LWTGKEKKHKLIMNSNYFILKNEQNSLLSKLIQGGKER
jgi:hypothetical protein